MSLILEALKKSEANRRLGNAPDLATPFATPKAQRGLLPYLVFAIAIVLAGGLWMLHRQATSPAPTTNLATTAQVPVQKKATAPAQHSLSGSNKPTDNASANTSAIWVAAQRPNARATARENREQRQRMAQNSVNSAYTRAPSMGNSQHAAVQPKSANTHTNPTNKARPISSPGVASAHPDPRAHGSAPHLPTPTPLVSRAPTPTQTSTTASTKPNPTNPSAMVAGPGSAPTKPALPAEPATAPTNVPPYYQLAFDVRKALPDLKLSMHVYSNDPAARFIILNGSRMTEGEKTTDDVTLQKIVPDGVILEFQGHEFFYPRDAL